VPLSSAPAGTALAACATPIRSISDESMVKGASDQEPPAAPAAAPPPTAAAAAADAVADAAAEGAGEAPPSEAPPPPTGTHSQSLMGSPATDVRTEAGEREGERAEEGPPGPAPGPEEPPPGSSSAVGSKTRPNGAAASDPSAGDRASWTAAAVVPAPPGGCERGPTAYQPTRSSAGKVCLSAEETFFFSPGGGVSRRMRKSWVEEKKSWILFSLFLLSSLSLSLPF
jgi:hypothetical protein